MKSLSYLYIKNDYYGRRLADLTSSHYTIISKFGLELLFLVSITLDKESEGFVSDHNIVFYDSSGDVVNV